MVIHNIVRAVRAQSTPLHLCSRSLSKKWCWWRRLRQLTPFSHGCRIVLRDYLPQGDGGRS
jgi:hypothetical protein